MNLEDTKVGRTGRLLKKKGKLPLPPKKLRWTKKSLRAGMREQARKELGNKGRERTCR